MRAVALLLASLGPAAGHAIALAGPGNLSNTTIPVEGFVVAATSRWTSDGSRIVTEATVRTPDGDVVVSQLGGSVDGLGMRTFPGPEIMRPGMRVALAAAERLDLAQRTHLVVDQVRVLDYPPGFVRTGPTQQGNFLFWESGCVFVTPAADGTKQVLGDDEFEAIAAAVNEWNTNTADCSYLDIVLEEPIETEVGRDNRNVIKFRDVSWCRPAIGDDPMRCHAPSAAGLTTAVFVDDADSSRDGAIVDADIELNGEHFAISHLTQTTGTAACKSEITNTLTHELGHLLGLEHPCRASGDPPRIDDKGNPVPACNETSDPEIIEATMFNFQDCEETKKATLSADDIEAICTIYPKAEDPGVCQPVGEDTGCCSASDRSPPPLALVAGAVGLVLVLRRKHRGAGAARSHSR